VLRPLATIVTAILLSRPEMPREEAERYARVVQEEAKTRDFDPLTAVAIIHFESGWVPSVVSADGEDYGLGQIRARYVGACRNDDDPLSAPSAECQQVKQSLLDAESNLRTMGQVISENKKLCFTKTHSNQLSRWLASYQGLNFPKQRRWCVPGEKTWRVVRYRDFLLRETAKRPTAKGNAARVAAAAVAPGASPHKSDAPKAAVSGGAPVAPPPVTPAGRSQPTTQAAKGPRDASPPQATPKTVPKGGGSLAGKAPMVAAQIPRPKALPRAARKGRGAKPALAR